MLSIVGKCKAINKGNAKDLRGKTKPIRKQMLWGFDGNTTRNTKEILMFSGERTAKYKGNADGF